jgi:mannosyl-3-phosphoglycerate phosphatase
MDPESHLLVFTDLDGTLLDHYDYSWSAAEEALSEAKARGIPIITNSSKTLAESLALQRQLGLAGPMIFENGAGVALPKVQWPEPEEKLVPEGDYWIKTFTLPYEVVRACLAELRSREQFRFRGFGDMNIAEICEVTGLSRDAAALAQQRRFGEPVLWDDSELQLTKFLQGVEACNLRYTQGGRFLHIMGESDKGEAMQWVARQYASRPVTLVALGDGENDLPMLRKADVAVLVRSPAHEPPKLQDSDKPPFVTVTEDYGPKGWNKAVLKLMKESRYG